MVNALVPLKQNRAVVYLSIAEDVKEEVVEVESKVEKVAQKAGSCVSEKYHIVRI
jgi:hypothetical protein